MGKKLLWETFYVTVKKGQSPRAAAREIKDLEGLRTIYEYVIQNCFWKFKEDDTNLDNKLKSGRPSDVDDETLLKMVEQQSCTTTHTMWRDTNNAWY